MTVVLDVSNIRSTVVMLVNANKVKVKMFTARLLYGLPTFKKKKKANVTVNIVLHYRSDSLLARS